VFVAGEISDVSVGAAIASKLVHTSFIDPTPTVEMSPMPGAPLNDVADMGMSNNAGLASEESNAVPASIASPNAVVPNIGIDE
jgi:hypothetical protein